MSRIPSQEEVQFRYMVFDRFAVETFHSLITGRHEFVARAFESELKIWQE